MNKRNDEKCLIYQWTWYGWEQIGDFMYDYVNGSEKVLEEYNVIGLLDLFKDKSLR